MAIGGLFHRLGRIGLSEKNENYKPKGVSEKVSFGRDLSYHLDWTVVYVKPSAAVPKSDVECSNFEPIVKYAETHPHLRDNQMTPGGPKDATPIVSNASPVPQTDQQQNAEQQSEQQQLQSKSEQQQSRIFATEQKTQQSQRQMEQQQRIETQSINQPNSNTNPKPNPNSTLNPTSIEISQSQPDDHLNAAPQKKSTEPIDSTESQQSKIKSIEAQPDALLAEKLQNEAQIINTQQPPTNADQSPSQP